MDHDGSNSLKDSCVPFPLNVTLNLIVYKNGESRVSVININWLVT